jgi:hypothetical protein
MNHDDILRKLYAAARAHPPGARVPYAFERRVLALIKARCATDPWGLWSRALWRAAAPCVGLMLLLGAWSIVSSSGSGSNANTGLDLSQQFEYTVLAAADSEPMPEPLR